MKEYRVYSGGWLYHKGNDLKQALAYFERVSRDNCNYAILKENNKIIKEYKGKAYLFGEKVQNELLENERVVKTFKPTLLSTEIKLKFAIIEKDNDNNLIVNARAEINEMHWDYKCKIEDIRAEKLSNEENEKAKITNALMLGSSFNWLLEYVMDDVFGMIKGEMLNG